MDEECDCGKPAIIQCKCGRWLCFWCSQVECSECLGEELVKEHRRLKEVKLNRKK